MRRLIILLGVLIGLLPVTFPAYACSGGPTFEVVFDLWPTLVYAEVMQVDAYGQNALLQVREVLSGEASERILLVRNMPGQTAGVAEGVLGNGDCNFIDSPLEVGDSFYIHLRHELHGGYSGGWTYRFEGGLPPSTPQDSDFEPLSARWENEDAFRAEIAEITGETPHAPTALPLGLPRLAPLHITLQDDTTHLLPVDSDEPIALNTLALRQEAEYGFWIWYFPAFAEDSMGCMPSDCDLSPDGAYLVRNKPTVLEIRFGGPIDSEEQALSPVGGLLASVYKGEVTLYRLEYARNGNVERFPVSVKRFALDQTSDSSLNFHWSADGRRLTFTDDRGLWLWDVYITDTPTLIRGLDAAGLAPVPRQFSPLGNYIEVLQGDSVFWVEAQPDGAQLPWGYWSPDEMSLLAQADEDIVICPAIDPKNCQSVLVRVMNTGGDVSMFLRLKDAAWHTPYQLTYWACDYGDEECNAITVTLAGYWSENHMFSTPYVSQFVYEPTVNQLALIHQNQLMVDGRPIVFGEADNRIIGLRWLRPLWDKS